MNSYLREAHRTLPAYVPGVHDESGHVIRLNTNESPYPPSQEVLDAIAAASLKLNYYNDPDCTELIRALARRHNVASDNLIIGNGSDQVLQLAFLAFADAKCPIYLPDVTYSYYDLFAALYQIPLRRIPLGAGFVLNPEDYYDLDGMIVFPNPNAPSGLALTPEMIRGILERNPKHVVLVDEAYVDFGAESVIPLIRSYPNLLVVHTFSKSGSLAGIRLGYGIGDALLIADLARVRNAVDLYGVNRLAQAAGVAACQHWDYYAENCARIVAAREMTTAGLRSLGFTVTDSLGNFVFARHESVPAVTLQKKLEACAILVRHFDGARTADWLRISIGTMSEMEQLLSQCRRILAMDDKA